MKELLCDYPERYTHFQFSILQLLPKAVTKEEVIHTETLWKQKLLTYEPRGMNANWKLFDNLQKAIADEVCLW